VVPQVLSCVKATSVQPDPRCQTHMGFILSAMWFAVLAGGYNGTNGLGNTSGAGAGELADGACGCDTCFAQMPHATCLVQALSSCTGKNVLAFALTELCTPRKTLYLYPPCRLTYMFANFGPNSSTFLMAGVRF